jgi:hypothetical protein
MNGAWAVFYGHLTPSSAGNIKYYTRKELHRQKHPRWRRARKRAALAVRENSPDHRVPAGDSSKARSKPCPINEALRTDFFQGHEPQATWSEWTIAYENA